MRRFRLRGDPELWRTVRDILLGTAAVALVVPLCCEFPYLVVIEHYGVSTAWQATLVVAGLMFGTGLFILAAYLAYRLGQHFRPPADESSNHHPT